MNALVGKAIGISVSDAPDRARLGFPVREVDRALFSICMVLVRNGARIIYAGDLRPTGNTFKILRHLAGAYAGAGEIPFTHVIPEPVLRQTSFTAIFNELRETHGMARTLFSIGDRLVPARQTPGGVLVHGDSDPIVLDGQSSFLSWLSESPSTTRSDGFTQARTLASKITDARVALGGKMGLVSIASDHYEGAMPGVIQEAIETLESKKPFVPIGAFGGASRDIAIALNLLDASERVPRAEQERGYVHALDKLSSLAAAIPDPIRPRLREIAGDDRTEAISYAIAQILADWLAIQAAVIS